MHLSQTWCFCKRAAAWHLQGSCIRCDDRKAARLVTGCHEASGPKAGVVCLFRCIVTSHFTQLQQFDCCRWCRVPTLTGVKELSIRPGTQPGDRLRMRGLGMPHLGGYGQGDQYVHVNVTLPRSTTQRQRELLIEFQNESKQKAA